VAGVFTRESVRRARKQPRVLAAYGVLIAAIGTAAWHFPVALWRLYVEIDDLAAQTKVERQLRGPRYVGVDTDVFVAARRVIPERDVYFVAVGDRTPANAQSALDAVPPFAAWWLLPRRQTRSIDRAEWVIAYGVDPRSLGVRLERIVNVDQGVAIAELSR
jgi:hypothetical protein